MSFILETKNFKLHVQKINKSVDLKKRSKKQTLLAQNSYEIFSPPITLTLNTCLSGVIYPIRFERWLKKIIFVLKEAKGFGETFICICMMAFFGMSLLSVDNCSLILESHQLCKTIPTSVG